MNTMHVFYFLQKKKKQISVTVIFKEWAKERRDSEKESGRGLIGFLWLQLNNIMHILA